MRGTRNECVSTIKKATNTNVQKQRPESTVVFRACLPLAPSARGGSERPAPAKIIAATTPNQKSVGSKDEPTHPNWIDAIKRRIITTTAPEQTAREPRPASAASTTWSQTLCTRLLPKEFDYIVEDID